MREDENTTDTTDTADTADLLLFHVQSDGEEGGYMAALRLTPTLIDRVRDALQHLNAGRYDRIVFDVTDSVEWLYDNPELLASFTRLISAKGDTAARAGCDSTAALEALRAAHRAQTESTGMRVTALGVGLDTIVVDGAYTEASTDTVAHKDCPWGRGPLYYTTISLWTDYAPADLSRIRRTIIRNADGGAIVVRVASAPVPSPVTHPDFSKEVHDFFRR